ncbi:hypothetical protein B0T18DRAFT_395402 [Schizothecium vesticola]|uniref:Uncharacterized protein n=1 Tax=Schizothecium vesticola TaxID=314040 RepID=A0AA40F7R8_9PEZI|nr:hypothetical protein B0T18DRAFT_395402 [Schizothecium vesticola]
MTSQRLWLELSRVATFISIAVGCPLGPLQAAVLLAGVDEGSWQLATFIEEHKQREILHFSTSPGPVCRWLLSPLDRDHKSPLHPADIICQAP